MRMRKKSMGDLDIDLIKEFACRPAFYDRSNIHFKDKVYIQHTWKDISRTLGYDVPLLKDRMLQLRNRYNLEKRRLENLRAKNHNKGVCSPWPLFNHLRFLDSHIRPRRSYKSLMSRRVFDADNDNPSSTMMGSSNSMDQGFQSADDRQVEIKYEEETLVDSEEDARNCTSGEQFTESANYIVQDSEGIESTRHSNFPAKNGAAQRSNNTGFVGIPLKNLQLSRKRDLPNDDMNAPTNNSNNNSQMIKRSRMEKYETFAKFLALSLCDLPDEKAMLLIEKFTSDLARIVVGTEVCKNETLNTLGINIQVDQTVSEVRGGN